MGFRNQVQLITYPDSLGRNLKALHRLLSTHLAGLFPGGVHILPFFPSSADRGFAPMTYLEVEPAFGEWADIRRIAADYPIVADLMVNHISRRSRYFQDFARRGRRSEYADLFITLDKIWPNGQPPAEDVAKIFLRKPDHPFSDVTVEETGETERLWTSFGTRDWSEQIDLDVHSAATRELLTEFLVHLGRQGIKIVRLDAVGYVIKKPGTSCFFVEPEIYDFMEWIRGVAASADMEILPEVHAHYSIQFRLAEHGFWVYDFVLPMLILHTLLGRDARQLVDYLRICPRQQVTMLDCHDGIPVQPDLDDILTLDESKAIVDRLVQRGANLNRLLSSEKRQGDFDAHQINCTYYSALEADDDAYLTARAIQFFAPGVPQVYYVGLLAGENDYDAVAETGEGRAVNRHNYSEGEVALAVQKPVVQRLMKLIRFRNDYPAFDGDLSVGESDGQLRLSWTKGEWACTLTADLETRTAEIRYRDGAGGEGIYRV
jgi:sucrose phosphorylase